MLSFIPKFAGLAMAYAGLASLVVLVGLRLWRGAVPWAWLPLIFSAFTFFFLTQHPFPSPSSLSCPTVGGLPKFMPLNFMEPIEQLWRVNAPLRRWLSSQWVLATAMNFFVCAVIGVFWGRLRPGLLGAGLFGFGLSMTCELTQLTGIWGIYPCAYRSFNVDDLLLNTLGVMAGTALVMGLARLRRPA